MFDTSGTDQQIRHGVYLIRLPPDNQNFQAIIVIQVYVQRGNNGVLVIVLQLRKPFRQQSHMVVVHQGDRAHDCTDCRIRRSRIRSRKASERLVYPCAPMKASKRSRRSESTAIPIRLSSPM
jgi:hypothetical protein